MLLYLHAVKLLSTFMNMNESLVTFDPTLFAHYIGIDKLVMFKMQVGLLSFGLPNFIFSPKTGTEKKKSEQSSPFHFSFDARIVSLALSGTPSSRSPPLRLLQALLAGCARRGK